MNNLDHLSDCVEISRYVDVKAKDVIEGDLLHMNFAGDATVTSADSGPFQTVLTLKHADGDESACSYRPDETLQIRPRN